MSWFAVLKTLLSLTNRVAKYMADRQLLKSGEYKAIAENNAQALEKIDKAQRARAGDFPISELPDDPNNRDNN